MKMVKSLLLGSAAGLVAVAGAQAADLPVKAKAVEYVKVCSLYGAGFYYIPGTDTCIKIGGFLRTEWNHNSNGSFAQQWSGEDGYRTRDQDTLMNRSRGIVSFDVRSQTEYGTLRSYLRAGWQWTSRDPSFGGSAGQVYLDRAFIQLAGFTFGKTQSFFDVPSIAGMTYQSGIIWQDYGGKGTPVFAYTAALGNGVTATLSLEDHSERRGAIVNLSTGAPFTVGTGNADSGAGNHVPDIVGNLRVDQAWGSAQISGALHANRAAYYGANQTFGHPSDEWGWAVGAGINLRMPWNPKDTFALAAQYGKGASVYVLSPGGNPGTGASLVANLVNQGTIANAWADDGYYIAGGSIDQSEAWSASAGFQHYWTPTLRQSLYGTYADYQAGGQVDTTVCGVNGAGCLDWSAWSVGSRLLWNPVSNLDVGLEVMYTKIEGTACANGSGAAAFGCGTVFVGDPIGSTLATGDTDTWSAILRVQRNFWP